jgi:nucleoredoxin
MAKGNRKNLSLVFAFNEIMLTQFYMMYNKHCKLPVFINSLTRYTYALLQMSEDMLPLQRLLGEAVTNHVGQIVSVASMATHVKVIGLYFSAHWCPPCRAFTPVLAAFYNNVQAQSPSIFEIVFVSSDKDKESHREYYGTMPWLTIPFVDSERRQMLSKTMGVTGIPCLVFVNVETGATMLAQGVQYIRSNPSPITFLQNITPKSFVDIIKSSQFVGPSSHATSTFIPSSPTLLYFSARWCGPCQRFTPILKAWYIKYAATFGVTIIFISGDKTIEMFNEYRRTMPWLSLMFDQQDSRSKLHHLFHVKSIPTLLLVSPDGKVMCSDTILRIEKEPDEYPWAPKPVERLSTAAQTINEVKTAILFLDKLDDNMLAKNLMEEFNAVAKTFWDGGMPSGSNTIQFAYTNEDDESTERTRLHLGMSRDSKNSFRVVVLHIAAGLFYDWDSRQTLAAFIASVQDGSALGLSL